MWNCKIERDNEEEENMEGNVVKVEVHVDEVDRCRHR